MENLLGTSWPVFVGLTVVLFGGASFLMGQALAETWRPAWQCVLYGAMLGAADRFLNFALFDGELLTITGYVIHSAVLVAIAFAAHRLTQAHKMVAQYPWLYERAGLFA
ncbi:MAG: DUF6867 family protein, partial [Dongiaceae bacterium]